MFENLFTFRNSTERKLENNSRWSPQSSACVAGRCILFVARKKRFGLKKCAFFPRKRPPPNTIEKKRILLMEEILQQLIGSLSPYLQGLVHLRWCKISSINSISQSLSVYQQICRSMAPFVTKDLATFWICHSNVQYVQSTLSSKKCHQMLQNMVRM